VQVDERAHERAKAEQMEDRRIIDVINRQRAGKARHR
jgi:hypothetical protein